MISHSDFASDLVTIATGWLDWDFERAMGTDCCAILLAHQGKLDMLKAIYGAEEEEAVEPFRPGVLGGRIVRPPS